MAKPLNKLLQELGISDSAILLEDQQVRSKFLELVKQEHHYGTYFHDVSLRELLFDLVPHIDSIPLDIRELLANPPPEKLHKEQFIEDWNSDGLWPTLIEKRIDTTDFLRFIRNGQEVTRPFSERNLHNNVYFYSKLMEWYISFLEIVGGDRKRIVDIGSAYFGFGRIAESIPSVEEIMLVDINYPAGPKQLTEKTIQIGSNASNISYIEDQSVELVTLHNAIEHFTHGADAACIGELSRILKPGGKAIISPLFFEARFAISLNPVSAFFFLNDKELLSHVLRMRHSRNAFVRLSKNMLSPYAHIYNYDSLKATILEHQSDLTPILNKIEVARPEQEDSVQPEVFGIPFESKAFSTSPFYTLELIKTKTEKSG